ncbi:zf-DNL-domain-containing protein [Leucogyrophana mollusca]|uniref:Zf-DNL-domain-containing protein n=1 Tax=Leucogyrophana mollusca TaxID=85980 RepID=A0ACB8B4S8_9AGAM|nr:zf-DNL-domain-containing protein [Leucogyrophana mollusca]
MLPSRLFRCVGVAPPWRPLVSSHRSLPASVSVQLRLRLGVIRQNSNTSAPPASPSSPEPSSSALSPPSQPLTTQPLEPRLSLTFTCTAPDCSTRSSHTFTKRSYERGIVLVQCPGCKNRHLIADHLGWFKDSTEEGKLRTVEDILRARGEKVRRGRLDAGGVVEYAED